MLKKENSLRKTKEIENVFKNGKAFYNDFFGIKVLENNLKLNRFCIIISAKISRKSTIRNKIRRQIKAIILDLKPFLKEGFDCLIIVKRDIFVIDFLKIKNLIEASFKKVGFLK